MTFVNPGGGRTARDIIDSHLVLADLQMMLSHVTAPNVVVYGIGPCDVALAVDASAEFIDSTLDFLGTIPVARPMYAYETTGHEDPPSGWIPPIYLYDDDGYGNDEWRATMAVSLERAMAQQGGLGIRTRFPVLRNIDVQFRSKEVLGSLVSGRCDGFSRHANFAWTLVDSSSREEMAISADDPARLGEVHKLRQELLTLRMLSEGLGRKKIAH